MPPVAIAIYNMSRAGACWTNGLTVTNADTVNGNYIPQNDGRVILTVRNGSGSPQNISFTPWAGALFTPGQVQQSKTVNLAAGAVKVFGPFPPSIYGHEVLVTSDYAFVMTCWKMGAMSVPSRKKPVCTTTDGSRIEIPLNTLTRDGVNFLGGAPNEIVGSFSGHYFANDGQVFLQVRNLGTDSSYDFPTPLLLAGQAISDFNAPISQAEPNEISGIFPPVIYNQANGGVRLDVGSTNLRISAYWVDIQE